MEALLNAVQRAAEQLREQRVTSERAVGGA